jgi:hypothetical protein
MVRPWRLLSLAALLWLADCAGKSTSSERRDAKAGDAGRAGIAAGGASGDSGSGSAASEAGEGGTGTPALPPCPSGEVRCDASGVREVCTGQGWTPTDFVCATNVSVDDDVGNYCITKSDGSYRCWGHNPAEALPVERYRQVQLARQGPIGLTQDGRLLARGMFLRPDFQPVVSFSATNMGGNYGVCALFGDGSLWMVLQNPAETTSSMKQVGESLASASCVFEGLTAGVLEDGSLWTLTPNGPPPGNDFEEVALSLGVFCARRTGGEVTCFTPPLAGATRPGQSCAGIGVCPAFPAGRYRSITATGTVACAIDETGALICKRQDGADMPIAPGPYTSAKGGLDVLCAIRTDGSVACFRHGGGRFATDDIGPFVPVEPLGDPAW